MPAEPPPTSEPEIEDRPRRGPGRLRRWLLRPLLWGLAVASLALPLAVMVLQSRFVGERLAALVEARLSERLQRSVEIGSLSLRLLPLAVELVDVRIAGAAPGDPPFAQADYVLLEGDLSRLGGARIRLRRALLENPTVRLEFSEDGDSNVVRWRRRDGAAGESRLPELVEIGLLQVEGGVLLLDHRRLPLDLSARDFEVRSLGGRGLELTGQVRADDVEVTLPRARPYLGSVVATVRIEPGRFEILKGRVSGPDLAATTTGSWVWRGGKELLLQVGAQGRASLLDRLGYAEGLFQGRFHFEGGVAWRPEGWRVHGRVDSPALGVLDWTLRDTVATLSGDRDGLHVDLEGSYAGGRVTGTVTLETSKADRPIGLDLELSEIDLQQLLTDREIPVHNLGGRVSGPFHYRFAAARPRRGDGWAELAIEPAPAAGQEVLAVSGKAPLTIERGVVRSDTLRLTSASQSVTAAGEYDLATSEGSFDYELTSRRVERLFHLSPVFDSPGEGELWRPAAGSGVVAGTLLLRAGEVGSEVRLDLVDVLAPGFSADRLVGSMNLSAAGAQALRVELHRPGADVLVTGSVPFGGDDGGPLFSLSVDVAGWPLADLRAWMPLELPVDGPLTGSFQISGTPELPEGRLSATLRPGRVAGVEVPLVDVEIDFDPSRLEVGLLRIDSGAGEIRVEGVVDQTDGSLALTLASDTLDLSRPPFDSLGRGLLTGGVTIAGRLEGHVEEPRLEAELLWSDLRLEDRPLTGEGQLSTRARWDGRRLEVEGAILGLVSVAGGGRLDDRGVDVSLRLSGTELGALARLVSPRSLPEFGGSFDGVVTLAGEFDSSGLEARLELQRLTARHDRLTLENLEPVVLRLSPETLTIESLFLGDSGGESDLFVTGEVGLGAPGSLDLRLQTALSLEWLELLLPQIDVRAGTFDAIGSVGGTLSDPRLNGLGEVTGASVLVEGLPSSLEDLGGIVLFYPDRMVFDSVGAMTAGGTVQAGGTVDLPTADNELSYRFQLNGKRLTVRYPEGWILRGDAEMALTSTEQGRLLRGSVELERALYLESVGVGVSSLLQSFFQRRRIEVGETDELLSSTQLNVQVRGREALRVRNNVADLEGDIDLVLRGSLAVPVVFGKVELNPGGELSYSGNDYEVRRGLLTFANPYRIQPVVDLVAETDLREYEVVLNLSGTLERLSTTFSSDPPLADLEILALLTGSGTAPEVRPDRDTSSENLGAEGFLYGQASSLINERVNRLFGLDKLRIDPLTESSGDLSSARVTVGKRLSRDLFATYSYDPTTTEQQILELEWSVNRSLVLVLTQNGDGTYAVDARWEKAF